MGELFAGRYVLVDPLGSGGMGVVWRAWDTRTQTYCAAKVLLQRDAPALLRFIREQSLRLDHPHVLAPTGWAGEDDAVLFTMDIVGGGSLATLTGEFGALPLPWATVLLDQLLVALDTVHTAGVVHRDVKPANLLLLPTGRARPHLLLSDFGVAVQTSEPRLTGAPAVIGTPAYMAPEQMAGADPDPRQDLYAAGVVAVELLLGGHPNQPGSLGPFGSRDLPGGARLGDVLAGLLAERPDDRFSSAAEARAALLSTGLLPRSGERLDDGGLEIEVLDQVPPLPEGWTPAGPAGSSTRTSGVVAAVVATVVLLAGAGLLWTRPWVTDPPVGPTTPTAQRSSAARAVVAADIDGDGRGDLLHRLPDSATTGWLGTGDFSASAALTALGDGGSELLGVGDRNADGLPDIVARDRRGKLREYRAVAGGGFEKPVQIGEATWSGFDRLVLGDLDGDDYADALGRNGGTLYRYRNVPGTMTFEHAAFLGYGWDRYDTLLGADVDGDGHTDLLTRDADKLFLHRTIPATNAFGPALEIGPGWGRFDALVPTALNGDDRTDLLAAEGDQLWEFHALPSGAGFAAPFRR